MAITLFCYTTYHPNELELRLADLLAAGEGLFQEKFHVSQAYAVDDFDQDTAAEYGLLARSRYLIALNDKSAAHLVQHIPALVKTVFGENDVIVLYENEKLM